MPGESSRYIDMVALKKEDVKIIADAIRLAKILLTKYARDNRCHVDEQGINQLAVDRLVACEEILYEKPHPEVT